MEYGVLFGSKGVSHHQATFYEKYQIPCNTTICFRPDDAYMTPAASTPKAT